MISRGIAEQRYVVCNTEDLGPGDTQAVTVGGRRIAIACLEDGSYKAVADTCPHEMASLAKGKVEKMWDSHGVGDYRTSESRCVIVCPWHNFEFDLDTGLSPCEPERLRIKVYRVSVDHDKVVVFV